MVSFHRWRAPGEHNDSIRDPACLPAPLLLALPLSRLLWRVLRPICLSAGAALTLSPPRVYASFPLSLGLYKFPSLSFASSAILSFFFYFFFCARRGRCITRAAGTANHINRGRTPSTLMKPFERMRPRRNSRASSKFYAHNYYALNFKVTAFSSVPVLPGILRLHLTSFSDFFN